MGLNVSVVLFGVDCYFSFLIFKEFLGGFSMMLLEAIHKSENHLPRFFGVRTEVFFLAILGKIELPLALSFPFLSQEVPSSFS
jgi:hypothetical protein